MIAKIKQEIEFAEHVDDISDYTIIRKDCEVRDANGKLLAHFCKNILPLLSFNELAIADKLATFSRTRGLSAGKPNEDLEYYRSFKSGKAAPGRAIAQTKGKNYVILKGSVKENKRSMEVNNPVYSSAVGLYPKTNSSNLSKSESGSVRWCGGSQEVIDQLHPFISAVDKCFELVQPEIWEKQYLECMSHEHLFDTSFTTITVNKNFRTAVHKDKGNVEGFYSAIVAGSRGQYEGGYLLLPEYKIGFDLRDTDFLLFNPQLKHCNSKLYETDKQKEYNKSIGLNNTLVNNKPYISGDDLFAKRYSFVFYQRSGFV